MPHPLRYIVGLLIFAGASFSAQAQNLRCKNDFVQTGDSKLSVIEKCGEPAMKESFCKTYPTNDAPQTVPQGTVLKTRPCENIDEWAYKPGRGQFITILQFDQGRVSSIRYGDRIP